MDDNDKVLNYATPPRPVEGPVLAVRIIGAIACVPLMVFGAFLAGSGAYGFCTRY